MAEEKAKEAPKKERRPTAQKRDLQNEKRRLNNKAFSSQVSTAIRSLESSITAGDAATIQQKLNAVYALMDKGVKTNRFKLNTASRTKARLTKRALAKA